MAKKSAAQIRRMQQRAEARGESYTGPPLPTTNESETAKEEEEEENESQQPSQSKEDKARGKAAIKYQAALKTIEANEDLKAKERRSAKRRAEAIACEESKYETIQELMDWYDENKETIQLAQEQKKKRKIGETGSDGTAAAKKKKKKDPYILFVGQIPFNTDKKELFQHFQKVMGKKVITEETMTLRIPADEKKKNKKKTIRSTEEISSSEEKSEEAEDWCKGFAFAEFSDPQLMYECLQMHHTSFKGRRINVSRSAGGGKASRAEKNKERQKEQDEYISTTVDKILSDYVAKGELQEAELDDGAILLCKRRSAATVEAALQEYIEERGDKDLENPSSYFSRIICRVTEEGAANDKKSSSGNDRGRGRGRGRGGGRGGGGGRGRDNQSDKQKSSFQHSSILAESGVDMQDSSSNEDGKNISSIFPSMGRGRGRGRGGYM